MIYYLKNVIRLVLDMAYPRLCYACHKQLMGVNRYLCFACWRKVLFVNENTCPKCASLRFKNHSRKNCIHCAGKRFFFSQARSAVQYQGVMRQLLIEFKFFGQKELSFLLAQLICRQLKRVPLPSVPAIVVPVPMLPSDQRKKGYNHAALLAEIVAKEIHVPCENILRKKYSNHKQSTLAKAERKKNVAGVFDIYPGTSHHVHGKIILLLDDILTTGSTVNECARILKKYGCKRVYVATVARTI